jgi:hypothetical protein
LRTELATGVGSAGATARRDAERERADAVVRVDDGWLSTRAAICRADGDDVGKSDETEAGGGGGGGIGAWREHRSREYQTISYTRQRRIKLN